MAEEALRRIDSSTTFGELAVELSKSLNISKRRAAYELFMMWKRGLLDVRPRSPVSKYIWAIAACSIVALSFAAIAAGPQPFKAIFGIFVSYFLVGYLMAEAVYPRGDEIKPTARIGLSIIMSLALEA
ncbi:MAG: hypothetical protein JZD41_09315, partial [Thermoproteus sp.]|nr:hypothetical protein [Thermoproteus sp.]